MTLKMLLAFASLSIAGASYAAEKVDCCKDCCDKKTEAPKEEQHKH